MSGQKSTVLVTGAAGMIGSYAVIGLLESGFSVIGLDMKESSKQDENYRHIVADLGDINALRRIFGENAVDRVIHLAALAHTAGESDLSFERYYHVNVECAENIFTASAEKNIPVLFISTVDVFGFYDGKEPVSGDSPIKPVSNYGKSKALAEEKCKKLSQYDIFRFSPVYTETVKRDIQKRYYLKYPKIAYQVGKGTSFEILSVENAVAAMVGWCAEEPKNSIRIIKNDEPMWTPDRIKAEKAQGRAKIVLRFPRWTVSCGYAVLKAILGENNKTYLLNKAVHPLRSE